MSNKQLEAALQVPETVEGTSGKITKREALERAKENKVLQTILRMSLDQAPWNQSPVVWTHMIK